MSQEPRTVPLGTVTSWLSGGTPNRANHAYWGGTIPWISAASLKTTRISDAEQRLTSTGLRAGSKLAPEGSILVLVRGMSLHRETRIGIADRPVSFNQDVKALVPHTGVLPEFLVYALQARSAQILDLVSSAGSGTGVLDTGLLKRLPIWLPDPREQQSLVEPVRDAENAVGALAELLAKKEAIKQGMAEELLSGRARLPGFAKPWKLRPFSEVMSRLHARKHQILASSYSDVGRLPVVDQGQKPVVGYTDDVGAAFNPGTDGVVVFGDHTCITKFVDFEFAVGADGTQLVKAKDGSATRFFAYALEVDPVISTGYNRHFKLLREKVLPVPDRAEQDAISAVLLDVDREIAVLQALIAKARGIKTGMAQQLLTGRARLSTLEAVG